MKARDLLSSVPLKEPMSRIFSWKASGLLAASLMGAHGLGFAQTLQTVPSMPLATFQDSLGVGMHIEYTDGKYADATAVLSDLQYLGIRNVRDGVPQPALWLPVGQGLAAMQMLASNGIRWDLLASPTQPLATSMQQLDNLVTANPGMLISVEGPNEINNQPLPTASGQTEEQAAEQYQRQLYSLVHADPKLQGIPVLYFTGGAPIDLKTNPGLADFENTHPYPKNGVQPYPVMQQEFINTFIEPNSTPKVITETGYYTLPQSTNWGGVDEPAQAELILNSYFDAALQGITHTYVYQLLDPYADPQNDNNDDHFGFFHLDNSPKIVAVAMHQMAGVLPPDQPSSPVNVQAAITGLPSTAHTLALTGSDGSITLFMWNEAPVWDEPSESLLWVTPVPVQVQLPGSWSASFFTPALASTFPMAATNGVYQTYVSSYPTAIIFKKH